MLSLDNNVIEEISGLDELVNLEWLDLSFNNISEIKGINKLTHLKDLSLYNNKISKIENLDGLTELQVLSLGNNQIEDLNQIRYLRDFPNLQSINFAGCKISTDQEYKTTILAFLDHIKYLDYALVKEQEVIEAKETKQDELQGMQESDKAKQAIEVKKKEDEKRMTQLREAYLDVTVTLLDEILTVDQDIQRLKILPGIDKLIEQLNESFVGIGETVRDSALDKYKEMKDEYANYLKVVVSVKEKAEKESVKIIETFNKEYKKLYHDSEYKTKDELEEDVGLLTSKLTQIKSDLMLIEIDTVEVVRVYLFFILK